MYQIIYKTCLHTTKNVYIFSENGDIKHWVLDDHCTTLFIPQPYPDLTLPTKCGQFYYKIFQTSGYSDSDYTKKCTQVCLIIINKYNRLISK